MYFWLLVSFIVILQLTHFGFKLTVWEELYFMVNCKAYSRTLPFSNECVRVDDLNKRTDFVQSLVSSRVLSNLTLSTCAFFFRHLHARCLLHTRKKLGCQFKNTIHFIIHWNDSMPHFRGKDLIFQLLHRLHRGLRHRLRHRLHHVLRHCLHHRLHHRLLTWTSAIWFNYRPYLRPTRRRTQVLLILFVQFLHLLSIFLTKIIIFRLTQHGHLLM